MYRVLRHHKDEYGEDPGVIVDVPGLVTIFGSYSEHVKGCSLMCASSHGLRIAISKRDDKSVSAYNYTMQERKSFQISGLKVRQDNKWLNAVKATVHTLLHDGLMIPGFNLSITGEAANSNYDNVITSIVSGLVYAFNYLLDLGLDEKDMIRLSYKGISAVSTESVKLRNIVALYVLKKGYFLFFDTETAEYKHVENPFTGKDGEPGLFLLDSGVPFAVFSEESSLMKQTANALKKITPLLENNLSMKNLNIRELKYHIKELGEDVVMFAAYAIGESKRAEDALSALQGKNTDAFKKLLSEHQKSLFGSLGFYCPELDWLCKRTEECRGVRAAGMVSVGILGQILVFGYDKEQDDFAEKMREYDRIFDFKASMRRFWPFSGLRVIKDDEDIIS